MRYLLLPISILATMIISASEEKSVSSLIHDFYKSKDYQIYLDADVISAQVMVPIKIDSFDEVAQLPNPVIANLFIKYIKKEYELDSTVVYQSVKPDITNPL